jgi:hypothetical protein
VSPPTVRVEFVVVVAAADADVAGVMDDDDAAAAADDVVVVDSVGGTAVAQWKEVLWSCCFHTERAGRRLVEYWEAMGCLPEDDYDDEEDDDGDDLDQGDAAAAPVGGCGGGRHYLNSLNFLENSP